MKLELTLCALALVLLIHWIFGERLPFLSIVLPISLLLLLAVHMWITPYRWQILPIWLVVVLTQAIVLTGLHLPGYARYAVFALGLLSIVASFVLVLGMPLLRLPSPDGRYGVGTVETTLVDEGRPSFLSSSTKSRRLFVKVWYPVDRKSGSAVNNKESL